MAASDAGRDGGEGRGLAVAARSAPGRAAASPGVDASLEELAVCRLCGLVMRRPFPPECPACGGGSG